MNLAATAPSSRRFDGVAPFSLGSCGVAPSSRGFGDGGPFPHMDLAAVVKGPNMARGGVNSLFKKSTNSLEQEVSK